MEKVRPRFWYFEFSNCGADIVHSINYTIHAVNLVDVAKSEFSFDKQQSLLWHQCAAFSFVALGVVLLWSVKSSPGSGRLSVRAIVHRPLICGLIVAASLSALGDSCLAWYYQGFALDGVGDTSIQLLGILCVSLAKAMVSLVLLMVAKGWYLFKSSSGKLLLVFLAMIIFTTVCAELHGEYALLHGGFGDASISLSLYEGTAGLLILVLNTLLFVEALRSIYITYTTEPSSDMRWFYLSVSMASFIFFLSLPLSCILARLFAPWVRAKYIARIEVTSRFVSAALLTYCLWPSHLDIMIRSRLEEGRQEELEGLELTDDQE